MRLLVCGGREYLDKGKMFSYLDAVHKKWPITCLIHGGARGADKLAGEWAEAKGILIEEYQANWEKHGKSAEYIRNAGMLRTGKLDGVVAFPGGKGTANMVDIARKAGLKVRIVT